MLNLFTLNIWNCRKFESFWDYNKSNANLHKIYLKQNIK